MTLGSRTVERGGRAIFRAACPASTPREPLLFLYPRLYGSSALLPTEGSHSNSDLGNSAAPLEAELSNDKPPKDVETGGVRKSGRVRPLSSNGNDNHRRRSVKPSSLSKNVTNHSSARVQRILDKLSSKVEKRKAKEEYEETTRRLYRARTRRTFGMLNEEDDWRKILSTLVENTPQVPEIRNSDGTKLEVPSTAVPRLLYDAQNNIWKIAERTHCKIQMLPKIKGLEETRILLLKGRRSNVSRVIQELQGIVFKTAENTATDTEETESFDLTTFENPGPQTIEETQSLDLTTFENPVPPTTVTDPPPVFESIRWTKTTFEKYVRHLTRSGRGSPEEPLPTGNSEARKDHVRNRLYMLFENPNLHGALSVDAFNMAMAYFIKNALVRDARRLFVGMDMIGLRMKTETFNIMLRGAAKIHDLHNFNFLLTMMLKRGYLPDAWTWLAFLSALSDFQVQVHVIAAMRKKGLLRHSLAVQTLCRELSSLETEWSIMRKQSHLDFVQHMDQRYGPHWLSTESANRIFHQLALHGLFSRCCTFAAFMDSRLVKPDGVSLQTVISHCRILKNFEGAVQTLKFFQDLGVEPNAGTYNDLFFMTMDQKLYSSARVVWRYACLNNATTWQMRRSVRDTSSRWLPPQRWTRPTSEGVYPHRKHWLERVGKVILGNAATLARHPAVYGKFRSDENALIKDPKQSLTSERSYLPPPTIKKEIVESKKSWIITNYQVKLDLLVHEQWFPASRFCDILGTAFHQDREWYRQKIWFKKGLLWMLREAIGVKIFHRFKKDPESGKPVERAWRWN